jgi:hypothetical protein
LLRIDEHIELKILHDEPATGSMTLLLRMRAGACYHGGRHSADEHAFVLDGDVDFDDRTLCAGDCAMVGGYSFLSAVITQGGCMASSVFNVADQALSRIGIQELTPQAMLCAALQRLANAQRPHPECASWDAENLRQLLAPVDLFGFITLIVG